MYNSDLFLQIPFILSYLSIPDIKELQNFFLKKFFFVSGYYMAKDT
jgi:hypothetical protein